MKPRKRRIKFLTSEFEYAQYCYIPNRKQFECLFIPLFRPLINELRTNIEGQIRNGILNETN